MWGGGLPPSEENANLPVFTPDYAHLLLWEVYGEFPHHNDGSHLDGGVADDFLWQRCGSRLAAQSARGYATPTGAVGHRFTAVMVVKWQGVINRSWNSKRPLVFAHCVLTKTLGVRRAQEIRVRITRGVDFWERVIHAGLVVNADAEGSAREFRASSGGE